MTRNNGQKAAQIETVSVALLLIDMTLYPRHKVDEYNVNQLVEALTAGETLPPVVADRASRTVIDGVHRVNAVVKRSGPQADIAIIWKDYASRQAMFEDAVRLNARHGRKLTAWDAVRITRLGQEYGMTVEGIASALAMTAEKVTALIATSFGTKDMKPIELKYAMRSLSGQELTPQQVEANRHANGIHPLGVITQVLSFLGAGIYDMNDGRTRARLVELRDALNTELEQKPVAEAA